jgi:formylglycine-generating enzyme required for sulfatase activity/serine/threonine protein phosphatase PrpC
MTLSFEIAGGQIDGARDYQEDAFLITHLGDNAALIIVADGMGGHAAGNVASNMAVQAFNKHVSSNFPSEFPHEVLNGAVLKANHSIAETIKETPALDGMGCTMVAALLQGNNIWWASVGDSHVYLLRNRELSKINADHSYGGFLDAMAKAGTPVEPEPGLARNMLMSAITGVEIADIDCPTSPLQLQHGDKILLCSDGMDTLSDGKIIQYSEWSESPKECVDALLNAVEEAESPKQDNTTVLVINVIDKAAQAGAAAQAEEEEKDDDDITDTKRSEKARTGTLDTTAEMITEIPQEPEEIDVGLPEPELTPETPAPTITPVTVTQEESSESESSAGKIIAIAAAVIIAIAIGGYFMLGKDKAPVVDYEPDIADVTPVEPDEEIISGTETETIIEEETVVEETEPAITEPDEPAVVAEEPVKEAEPEPAAKTAVDTKGKEFTDALKSGGDGPEMVWIPAGTFEMGSPSTSVNADERPQHTVKVKKFAISKYEITFSEYDKFAKATGRKLPDNMYMDRTTTPVIFVSWDDAYNYARWLSEETGKKYRLPSEAEWEYAAAGGKSTPFWWGFNEEVGKAHCFTCESQFDPRKPTKIDSFQPNQFGIFDTAGNVAEWVHDCWHDSYKGAPVDGSVWEGGDCTQRVARGGSYMSPQQSIRTAKRDKFKSNTGYDHIGIRVVREE